SGPRPSGFSSNGSTENPSEHRLDPHEGITNILDDSFPKDSGKELGSKHQIHRSSLVKLRISERKVKRILLHLIRDGAGRKCFSYTRQHHGDCLEPSQRFVRRRNLEIVGQHVYLEKKINITNTYEAHGEDAAKLKKPFDRGPYFDTSATKNVTSLVGKTGHLNCRIKNLGNKTVSWIRHRDLHLLTVSESTYTSDQRFTSIYNKQTGDWSLQEAQGSGDAENWTRAMEDEFMAQILNKTWEIVERPKGRKDERRQEIGLEATEQDPCLFVKMIKGKLLIVTIYVDDLLIASNHPEWLQQTKEHLNNTFKMKDFGAVKTCLGIEFKQNKEHQSVFLSQEKYIDAILKRFEIHKPIMLSEFYDEPENGVDIPLGDQVDETERSSSSDEDTEEVFQRERRGRGRPKLMRTGQRGRPRKIYQQGRNVSADELIDQQDELDSAEDIFEECEMAFAVATDDPVTNNHQGSPRQWRC
ncbi:uncharacterized protein Dwil_GK27307, partial [Drosophila willistoni]